MFKVTLLAMGPGIRMICPRNAVDYMRDMLKESINLYGEEAKEGKATS